MSTNLHVIGHPLCLGLGRDLVFLLLRPGRLGRPLRLLLRPPLRLQLGLGFASLRSRSTSSYRLRILLGLEGGSKWIVSEDGICALVKIPFLGAYRRPIVIIGLCGTLIVWKLHLYVFSFTDSSLTEIIYNLLGEEIPNTLRRYEFSCHILP